MPDRERGAPKLIVDILVVARSQVLLVRYKDAARYDGQAGWFLPDDFLRHAEHPLAAARRILREQVGLDGAASELAYIESFGGDANGPAWHLVFHHALELDAIPEIVPGPGILEAQWFPLDGLPSRDAVAHHGWAIDVIGAVLDMERGANEAQRAGKEGDR